MPKKVVLPKGAPPPLAPYSPGTKAGNVVYTAGMVALDASGKLVGSDVATQTRQVLENIRSVIEAAGGSMADIVFNTIWLKDLADYAAMNKAYGEFFLKEPPARACIGAALVKPEFLVEIAAVAHVGARAKKRRGRK